ncbi:hypothetical protein [Micromonospora sp. DT62]|uniref:hypothetical protein n=1 Tax=Micromonospora sp. DT62 TaxID=3416521 RepID=UPI003CF4E6A0
MDRLACTATAKAVPLHPTHLEAAINRALVALYRHLDRCAQFANTTKAYRARAGRS